ncbi:hypothetical protein HJC23_010141 [Cyclotella cryptica]|uniref:Ycf49-like protein n=1 Tax=Cyclotella cryptica TaxID=29204 RepID=A0ABD3NN72_9STRA|eukprot:CCRYP_020303-RA/>CCRYP_020303-RA protein AED:0.00 eAED:0.00 QI:52/-1/1/1/-1/1/1/48/468
MTKLPPIGTFITTALVASCHYAQQSSAFAFRPARLHFTTDYPSTGNRLSRPPTRCKLMHADCSSVESLSSLSSSSQTLSFLEQLNTALAGMDQISAETLAGPFFGVSLFPYLAFLFFLQVPQNNTPKGVTVGFATCLLFVFLTIPAAIGAKVWYGVSLADCDWLHGSAESLLTVTNLVTVVAFRQALSYEEKRRRGDGRDVPVPESVRSYDPMVKLVVGLTGLAFLTALFPALAGAQVHTPYLNGFMDIPPSLLPWTSTHSEPSNALTVTCWIIHITSLVEFLVAMGFCWRYAEVTRNPKWKGLTWGLLPLHSSGITACTYHLFYNSIPVLVPLQAALTCVGNLTAMWAAFRIAKSNGWDVPWGQLQLSDEGENDVDKEDVRWDRSQSLVGFEDLGEALASDNDYTFILKLFVGCAVASYIVKYGEVWFDFPFESELDVALAFIVVPSLLNAFKWNKRSQDPTFEGWF